MNNKLFKEAVRLLENKSDFAFATIIKCTGSTPRTLGAKMIICADKSIFGTIGGGVLEAAVIRKASEVLTEKKMLIEEYNLNEKDLNSLGMSCGGNLEVLIEYINSSNPVYLDMFRNMLNFFNIKKPCYLATIISSEDKDSFIEKQFLLFEDGSTPGCEDVVSEELKSCITKGLHFQSVLYEKNKRAILESINIPHRVYIFGAGHIGERLVWILNFLDFPVTVIDDRQDFANQNKFPKADVRLVENFEKSLDALEIDNYSFIVIVTRGHIYDSTVLRLALKTNAGYIGMIGSRKKRDAIYSKLLDSGYTNDDLKRVHSPIGIPIGDETPEEIAVSIAAELIKIRSEME
jgi:xanthine dehydrogenase accessory factor